MTVERTSSSSSSFRRGRGWALLEPTSRREINLAQALGSLAEYCLVDQAEACRALVHRHLMEQRNSDTAGILAGGSDTVDIFRLVLQDEPDNDAHGTTASTAAGNELLRAFVQSPAGQPYQQILTVANIQKYMLGMCQRWNDDNDQDCVYHQLGNLMFILTWGSVPGQVRHIDDTAPNVQVCLYMSDPCPSTVLYSPTTTTDKVDDDDDDDDDDDEAHSSFTIQNTNDLIRFWTQRQQQCTVPPFLRDTLLQYGDVPLLSPQQQQRRRHTPAYCAWKSINATLAAFGKLYQPVQRVIVHNHHNNIGPGTMLVAADNFIHAGPPTDGPRMLLNAIGIPEEGRQDKRKEDEEDDVERDGEVQYNPVVLHLDLICILFTLWEDNNHREEEQQKPTHNEMYEAKLFLLRHLVPLIRDGGAFYGQRRADVYDSILGDSRTALAEWLRSLVQACLKYSNNQDVDDGGAAVVEGLLHRTLEEKDASLFHVPHLLTRRGKRRQKTRRRLRKVTLST
eukprot:scaffold15451_cov169-Amphora_coffeaeformis.AAC.2